MVAPSGTPADIVAKLNTQINLTLNRTQDSRLTPNDQYSESGSGGMKRWRKTHEVGCRAIAYMQQIFIAILFIASTALWLPVGAEVAGAWEAKTGQKRDEDAKPNRSADFFQLLLAEHRGLLCGSYNASSRNGSKIDFSQVFGRRNGDRAEVYFLNGFTGENTSFGAATLLVAGPKGQWEVTQNPDGESWVWRTAKVERRKLPIEERNHLEKSCADAWKALAHINFASDSGVLKFLKKMQK